MFAQQGKRIFAAIPIYSTHVTLHMHESRLCWKQFGNRINSLVLSLMEVCVHPPRDSECGRRVAFSRQFLIRYGDPPTPFWETAGQHTARQHMSDDDYSLEGQTVTHVTYRVQNMRQGAKALTCWHIVFLSIIPSFRYYLRLSHHFYI